MTASDPTDLIRAVDAALAQEAANEGGPIVDDPATLVRRLRDALEADREQLRLALIDQANTEAELAEARAQIAADRDAHAAEMLDADEAASETRRILSEQVERAQHEAEVERFKAIDATAEMVKARDTIERVRVLADDLDRMNQDTPGLAHANYNRAIRRNVVSDIRRAIEGEQA